MKEKIPASESLRPKDGVIDQRKQQIDPAVTGKTVITMPNNAEHSKEKRADPGSRRNAQGDHAGSAHSPDEFDVMNPQKQDLGPKKPTKPPKESKGDR
jgi:hypothetical protein